ncbi:hypothetical protein GCM10008938_41660 [Deinococcus roseus]|uniref:Uncharacterized protein n=2 Tax=Deinococcus roseus TaxID=392414 RepID=A0ABQ2DBF0_9DEIO|nr:hypothetical protein GCM10008938_41660 [Deinococcus roseus]
MGSYGQFRRKISLGLATFYLASQFLPFGQALASPDLISRPGAGSSRIPLQVMSFNAPGFGEVGDAVNLANGNLFIDTGEVTRNTTTTEQDAKTDPSSKMIGNWTTKSRLKLVNSQNTAFDQAYDLTSSFFSNLSGQSYELFLENGDASKSRFVRVNKSEVPADAPSWIKERYENYPGSQVAFYRLAPEVALQTTDEWIVFVRPSSGQGTYAHYYDHSGNRSTFHKDGPYFDYLQTLNQQYRSATASPEDPEGDQLAGSPKTEILYDTTNKDLIKEIKDEWGRKTVYSWNTDKTLKTVEYKYNGTTTSKQVDFLYTDAYGAGNVISSITYKTWSGKGAAFALDFSRKFTFAYAKQDIKNSSGVVVGNQAVISSITHNLLKTTSAAGAVPVNAAIDSVTSYTYSSFNGNSLAVTGVTQTGEEDTSYKYENGKSVVAGGMLVTVTQGSSVSEFHYDKDSRIRRRRIQDNQTNSNLTQLTPQVNTNREWRYEYYASGLLAIEVDPAGKVTHYAYDSRGNLIRKTLHKDSTSFDLNAKPIQVDLTSNAGSFNTGAYAIFKGTVSNDTSNQGLKYDLSLSKPLLTMPSKEIFLGGNYWRMYTPASGSSTADSWLSSTSALQERYLSDTDGLPYIRLNSNEQLKRLNSYLSPGMYKLSFKLRPLGSSTDPAGNLTVKVDSHTKNVAFPNTSYGNWLPQEFVFHKKAWNGELAFLTNLKLDLKDITLTPIFDLGNQVTISDVGHTDAFAWYPYLELGKTSSTTSPKTFLSNTGVDPYTRQGGTINVASYDSGLATSPAVSGLYYNQAAPSGKYRISFEAQLDPADPNPATSLDVYYGVGLKSTWAEYQKATLSSSWQKFEAVVSSTSNSSPFGLLENTTGNHAWQVRNIKVEYLDGVNLYLPWGTSGYEVGVKATSVADPSASVSMNYSVSPRVMSITSSVTGSDTPSTLSAAAIQFALPAAANGYLTAPKFNFQAAFSSTLPAGTNKDVVWVTNATQDGGTVDSSGVFTAPAWTKERAGTSPIYDVTAISIDNPDVTYTLPVQVKYFNIELMSNPGTVRASRIDRNCSWFFGNCIFHGWVEYETYFYQFRSKIVNLPPPKNGVWWMPTLNWTSRQYDGNSQPISKNGCSRIPTINQYANGGDTGQYSISMGSGTGIEDTRTMYYHLGSEYAYTACDAPMDTPGTHYGVEYIDNNEVMASGKWQYVLRDRNTSYADYNSGSLRIKNNCALITDPFEKIICQAGNNDTSPQPYSQIVQTNVTFNITSQSTLGTDQGSIQFFDDAERAGWVNKEEYKYNNDNQLQRTIHHTSSAVGTVNGLTPTAEQGVYNDQVTDLSYTLRTPKETTLKQKFTDVSSVVLQLYDLKDATLSTATTASVRSTLTTAFNAQGLLDSETLTAGSTTKTTTYQYPSSASGSLTYRNGSTLSQTRSVSQLFDRPQKIIVTSGSDSITKTLIYDEFGNVGSELTWSGVVNGVTAAGSITASNLEKRSLYNGFGQQVWTGSLIAGASDYTSESYNNFDSNGQIISTWSGQPSNQTVYHYTLKGALDAVSRGVAAPDDYLATSSQFVARETTLYTLDKVDYGRVIKERRNWWGSTEFITRVYDNLDRVIKETRPDGSGFERQYDAFGTASEVTLGAGGVAEIKHTWLRNTLGQVTSDKLEELTGDKRSNTTYYLNDLEGRVLQTSQSNSPYHATAADSTTFTLYDVWGNVLWSLGSKLKTTGTPLDSSRRTLTTFKYDNLNRKTEQTQVLEGENLGNSGLNAVVAGLGAEKKATTTYLYQGLDLVKDVIDPLGYHTITTSDRMGNVYKTSRDLWLSTDPADLQGKTTGDTVTTMAAFDAAGRVTIKRDPNGKLAYTRFDKLGNPVLQSDFAGNVIDVRTYTADGLLKSVKAPKIGVLNYLISNWDVTDIQQIQARDDKFVTTEAYEYSGYGLNPSKVVKANMNSLPDASSGSAVTGGVATTYQYNFQGKATLTTLPDTRTAQQKYDENGNVTYAKSPEGFETYFSYDAFGNLIRKEERARVLYNTDGSVKLDASGKPTPVTSTVKVDIDAGLTAALISSYKYDLAGNITQKTERGITTDYEYNTLGKVVRESRGHKSSMTSGFAYKQYRYRLDGEKVLETSYSYAASVTPGFNNPVLCAGFNAASGSSGNQHVWQLDALGQVVQECSNGWDSAGTPYPRKEFTASFTYNGAGARVKRVFDGDSEIYSSYDFDTTLNTLISADKSNARSKYNTYWKYDKRGLLLESFDYLTDLEVNTSLDTRKKFNVFGYTYNDNGQETLATRNAQVIIKAPLRQDPNAADKDQYKPAAALLAASVGSIETKYNERGLILATTVLDRSPKVAKDSDTDSGLEADAVAQNSVYDYYQSGQDWKVTVKRGTLAANQTVPTYPTAVGTKEYTVYDNLGRVTEAKDSNGANYFPTDPDNQDYRPTNRFAGPVTITTAYAPEGGTTTKVQPGNTCSYTETTSTTLGGLVYQTKTVQVGCNAAEKNPSKDETKVVTNRYNSEGLPTGSLVTVNGAQISISSSTSKSTEACASGASGCYQTRSEASVSCTGTFSGSNCSTYTTGSVSSYTDNYCSSCYSHISWSQNTDGSPTGSGTMYSYGAAYKVMAQPLLVTNTQSYSTQIDTVLGYDNYLNPTTRTEKVTESSSWNVVTANNGTKYQTTIETGPINTAGGDLQPNGSPTSGSSGKVTTRTLTSDYNTTEGYLKGESGTEVKDETVNNWITKTTTTKAIGKSFVLDSRGNRIKFNSTQDQAYEFNNYKKRYDADGRISSFFLRKDLQDVWNNFIYDSKGNQILSSTGGLFQRKVPTDPTFTESYVKRNFSSTYFSGNQVQMIRHREGDFGFKYNYVNAITLLWFTLRAGYGELKPNNTYEKVTDARYQQIKDNTFTLADGINDQVDWTGVQATPFSAEEESEPQEQAEVLPEAILNGVSTLDVKSVEPIAPVDSPLEVKPGESEKSQPADKKAADKKEAPVKQSISKEQTVSSPEITTFSQGMGTQPVASGKPGPSGKAEEKQVGSAPAPATSAQNQAVVLVHDTTIKGPALEGEEAEVIPEVIGASSSGIYVLDGQMVTPIQQIDPGVLNAAGPMVPDMGTQPSDGPSNVVPSWQFEPEAPAVQKTPGLQQPHKSQVEDVKKGVTTFELIQVITQPDQNYLNWLVSAANSLNMDFSKERLETELKANNFTYLNTILLEIIKVKIDHVYGDNYPKEMKHLDNVLKSAEYNNSTSAEKFHLLSSIAYAAFMYLGDGSIKPDEKSMENFSKTINNIDDFINNHGFTISKLLTKPGTMLKIDSVMLQATADALYWYVHAGGGKNGWVEARVNIANSYPYMEAITAEEFMDNIDPEIGINVFLGGVALVEGVWMIVAIREGVMLLVPYTMAVAQRFGPGAQQRIQQWISRAANSTQRDNTNSLNLFHPDENLRVNFDKVPRVPGALDVGVHGSPNRIKLDFPETIRLTPKELANYLRDNYDLSQFSCIRLMACNTGSLPNGFARNLANELKMDVWAPDKLGWIGKKGDFSVAGALYWDDYMMKNPMDPGSMVLFKYPK